MRLLALIILLVSQVSVAKGKIDYSVFGDFAPYVRFFNEVAHSRGYMLDIDSIRIRYTTLGDGNMLGMCWLDTEGPTIVINRELFIPKSVVEKQLIIWHELGHCMLGKPHDSRLRRDGMPVSIMYPALQPFKENINWYLAHQDDYIRQFFPSIVDLNLKSK